jgi:hypothetical protein
MSPALRLSLLLGCWLVVSWAPAGAQVPCEERPAPDVLIVLDRSGSMEGANWAAARGAIDGMLNRLAPGVRVGLQLFPWGGSNCAVAQPVDAVRVGCDVGTADAIRRVLNEVAPSGNTPLGTAVDRARLYLAGIRQERAQYVVLITDGRGCGGEVDAVRRAAEAGDHHAGGGVWRWGRSECAQSDGGCRQQWASRGFSRRRRGWVAGRVAGDRCHRRSGGVQRAR